MFVTAKSRRQLTMHNAIFIVLWLSLAGLLAWLGAHYHYRADWTATGRYSLTPASTAVLAAMPGPIKITSYASADRPLRQKISDLVLLYQGYKDDIEFTFVNPAKQPQRIRELDITMNGEMIIDYQGRQERLAQLTEVGLSNALQRLLRDDKTVVFISGHGEREVTGNASHDLSVWASQLEQKGFVVQAVNLIEAGGLPAATAVVVLTTAKTDYLPAEVGLLQQYLERGGNLLWLLDPLSPRHGLDKLAAQLAIEFPPGYIIDPNLAQIGSQLFGKDTPLVALVANYPAHAIVEHLTSNSFFPLAGVVTVTPESEWIDEPLLITMSSTWLETRQQDGAITFDIAEDVPGPLQLGLALTRMQAGSARSSGSADEQRVVLIADSDFISNGFLGKGGNQQLAMNIINWLSRDEQLIDIPTSLSPDAKLELSRNDILIIGFGFLLLPLFLLGSGLLIGWRRRRR